MPAVPLFPKREDFRSTPPRAASAPTPTSPFCPQLKGEEPKPGWAQASPTDRLMTAAEAGEDRELGGEREPDPMAGGSLPPLGVCFVSLLCSADPRHVLLPEARTGASDNVVLEE